MAFDLTRTLCGVKFICWIPGKFPVNERTSGMYYICNIEVNQIMNLMSFYRHAAAKLELPHDRLKSVKIRSCGFLGLSLSFTTRKNAATTVVSPTTWQDRGGLVVPGVSSRIACTRVLFVGH